MNFDNQCDNETEADQEKRAIQYTTDYAQDLVKEEFKQIEQLIGNDQSHKFLQNYLKCMENKVDKGKEIQKIQVEINDLQKKVYSLNPPTGLQKEIQDKMSLKQELQESIRKLKNRQSQLQGDIWSFQQQLIKFN
ncbi:hypothetical protein pb186bvf_011106 [Paramecium bursaria]